MMGRQTSAKITKSTVALGLMLGGVVFCASGCKESAQPWQSFGEITTETRPLADFTKIHASHNIQLCITQDTSKANSIQITYGKNTLSGIVTKIKDGELIIEDKNQAKWLRNLNTLPLCTLNLHQISKIHLEGNAKLTCIDTLRTPALEFTVNSVGQQQLLIHCGQLFGGIQNSGYVNAAGTATIFSWSCEKGSGIDARNLLSHDVYMRHFTIHDVYVNPSKQFEAYAYNSGNIYYFQTPSYKFKVIEEGSGKVKLYQP